MLYFSFIRGFVTKQIFFSRHLSPDKTRKSHLDYEVVDYMKNGEDAFLFYQMIPFVKKIIQIPDIVYYYMQNTQSSSQRRYSDAALDNILLMNSKRISLVGVYPHLKKELVRYVSEVLTGLKILGYNKNGILSEMMGKYGLVQYGTNRAIIASHSLIEAAKILYRKYIIRHV